MNDNIMPSLNKTKELIINTYLIVIKLNKSKTKSLDKY